MDKVRVIYIDELEKGYQCNPYVDDEVIKFETKPFELIRKINDKEFVVKDPL